MSEVKASLAQPKDNEDVVDMFFYENPQPTIEIPIKKESIIRTGKSSYISYGEKNKYPNFLWSIYQECSTLQSIINQTAEYCVGNGVMDNKDFVNSKGENLEIIIKKLAISMGIYGGFAFKVTRNSKMILTDLIVLDMRNVRVNEDVDIVYFSKNWGGQYAVKNEVIPFPIYTPKQNESIYYYNGVTLSNDVYPFPKWSGSIQACLTEVEIGYFHLSNIKNDFSPSAIVSMNSGNASEENKRKTEEKLTKKYAGSRNTGKLLFVYSKDKDSAPTILRLADNGFDKRYEALQKSVTSSIYGAMSAQPALFGRLLENNTGFSNIEFMESFALYNRTCVRPMQMTILNALKAIGLTDITIKPFSLTDDEEKNVGDINKSDDNKI